MRYKFLMLRCFKSCDIDLFCEDFTKFLLRDVSVARLEVAYFDG